MYKKWSKPPKRLGYSFASLLCYCRLEELVWSLPQNLRKTNLLTILSLLNGVCNFLIGSLIKGRINSYLIQSAHCLLLRYWCIFWSAVSEERNVGTCCWWCHHDVSSFCNYSRRSWQGMFYGLPYIYVCRKLNSCSIRMWKCFHFPQLISIYGKALRETEKRVEELKSQK